MLPTKKTPPKTSLHEYTVLLYGPTKYGKSKMCSQADGALFLETEPGLNSLEVFRQPIGTWEELLVAAKEIAEGKHKFKTVIIDTVDNAYRMCADHVNKKFKVEHESDLEYGKGYSLVNAEFYRVLNKLALLPYGLFLVSHSQEKEIETRTGKAMKTIPTLPDKARKLVLGLVDIILFCDFEPATDAEGRAGYRRVLRTKPTAKYDAGDRTDRLPETIDFVYDREYASFVAAFSHGAAVPVAASVAPQPPATSPPGVAAPASLETSVAPATVATPAGAERPAPTSAAAAQNSAASADPTPASPAAPPSSAPAPTTSLAANPVPAKAAAASAPTRNPSSSPRPTAPATRRATTPTKPNTPTSTTPKPPTASAPRR